MGLKKFIILNLPIKIRGYAWISCGILYEKSVEANSISLLAIEKALAQKLGWEETLNTVRGVWRKLASESVKMVMDELGLEGDGADTAMKVFSVFALFLGFKHRITKLTYNEAVGIIYDCSHWNAMKRLDMTDKWDCRKIHMDFVAEVLKVINPKLKAELTKTMFDGDKYCEMIIRLKGEQVSE